MIEKKQVTTKGYSSLCKLDGKVILLTSYSLSYTNNVLKSGALVNLSKTTSHYNLSHYYINGYCSFEISISFEVLEEEMTDVLKLFYIQHDTTSKSIVLIDEEKDLTIKFNYCYLSSVSISVGQNSAVTCTKTFLSFGDSFNTQSLNGEKISEKMVGEVLVPYWKTSCQFRTGTTMDLPSLMDFSFSSRRNLTPIYGCCGSSTAKTAPKPLRIVSSLPQISLQITCFSKDHDIVTDKKINYICFNFGKDRKLKFTQCYLQSIAPNIGDINTIAYSYSVLGDVKQN